MAVPVKIEPSKPEEMEEFSTSVMQKMEQERVKKTMQQKPLFLAQNYKNMRYKFARPTVIMRRSILRFALRIVRSQEIFTRSAHIFVQKFPTIGNRVRLFVRLNPPPPPRARRSILHFIIHVIHVAAHPQQYDKTYSTTIPKNFFERALTDAQTIRKFSTATNKNT